MCNNGSIRRGACCCRGIIHMARINISLGDWIASGDLRTGLTGGQLNNGPTSDSHICSAANFVGDVDIVQRDIAEIVNREFVMDYIASVIDAVEIGIHKRGHLLQQADRWRWRNWRYSWTMLLWISIIGKN